MRSNTEYVQKQQQLPVVYSECDEKKLPMSYAASFDGDADRIVFHCKDSQGKLVLLDGDKIAVLVSSFIQEEILALSTAVPEAKSVRCGIVQTAYANGASTAYLKVSTLLCTKLQNYYGIELPLLTKVMNAIQRILSRQTLSLRRLG